jgi:hypothetical protein
LEPSNPAPEAPRSARRRLVRGAFAAPAVLALYSGSAAAMASNLRCVSNQVGAGRKVYPPPIATPDRYVRVRLWSLRKKQGERNGERWFLAGRDLDALRLNRSSVGNTFLRPGEWQEFNPTNQTLVGSKLSSQPAWAPAVNGKQAVAGHWDHDGVWVAIRIDATSQGAGIIGVVDGKNAGSAVSGLCWASFVTAAR